MFLQSVQVREALRHANFPFTIPTIHTLDALYFDQRITFFVGENGSGKSTLLEAIADQAGFPAAGGGRNSFQVHQIFKDEAALSPFIQLSWKEKTFKGFFLRAESFYQFAAYVEEMASEGGLDPYGGQSLLDQSHGESFMALFQHRFQADALYLLDEPESALSPQRQLAFLRIMHELAEQHNCQFIIATHSPILLGYPGAAIFSFDAQEIEPVCYEETSHYIVTKRFMDDRQRMVQAIFAEDKE